MLCIAFNENSETLSVKAIVDIARRWVITNINYFNESAVHELAARGSYEVLVTYRCVSTVHRLRVFVA